MEERLSLWPSASLAVAIEPADTPCRHDARNTATNRFSCVRKNETTPSLGSPMGQRHIDSFSVRMVARSCSGITSSSTGAGAGAASNSASYVGFSATLPRVPKVSDGARFCRGACVCVRLGRGTLERELVARPESPSRCTLPITALRVTPPKRPAIWLALSPSDQSFFSSSTLSSVQAMFRPPRLDSEFHPS